MHEGDLSDRVSLIRKPDKDWSAFDACETCRGAATIDDTPEGDLICATCRATLPRPEV